MLRTNQGPAPLEYPAIGQRHTKVWLEGPGLSLDRNSANRPGLEEGGHDGEGPCTSARPSTGMSIIAQ